MKRCDVYELLSFLANLDWEEDLLVPAARVNKIDDLLRADGIRCDFSRQSFELAAYEYPDLFSVCDHSVTIKAHPGKRRKFVFYNSNEDVALKIKETWQIVIKEF